MAEINRFTSFCKNAARARQSPLPVLLFTDSNEKEDVTRNLFPKMIAFISSRLMVATHFPPAKLGLPLSIFENCSQSVRLFAIEAYLPCILVSYEKRNRVETAFCLVNSRSLGRKIMSWTTTAFLGYQIPFADLLRLTQLNNHDPSQNHPDRHPFDDPDLFLEPDHPNNGRKHDADFSHRGDIGNRRCLHGVHS